MALSVGLILAKKNSKRLKNKNWIDYYGKPLFLWNVEKCLEVFDKVYVSSDSDYILSKAESVGAIRIERPKRLCGNTPNIPSYRHAQKEMNADIIVAVQANSPELPICVIKGIKKIMDLGIFQEVMTCHKDNSIYGSVWAMTKERLAKYKNYYNPTPEVLVFDPSADIHTKEDLEK